MFKTIACYKWVKAEEDLRINPDLTVDLSKAKGKISDYDRNAIEAARLFAEAAGSEAVGLTFSYEDAKTSLKDALARGLKQAFWVNDRIAESNDGLVTAKILASAIKAIGDYNLIVCAEGASDTYARQIGPRIGALLDIPVITCVKSMKLESSKLIAVRNLEKCLETVELELPAVVTVLPAINPAPIPGLKAVLEANKKPVKQWAIADLGLNASGFTSLSETVSFQGCQMDRKNVVYKEGTPAERVGELVAALKKEGVL